MAVGRGLLKSSQHLASVLVSGVVGSDAGSGLAVGRSYANIQTCLFEPAGSRSSGQDIRDHTVILSGSSDPFWWHSIFCRVWSLLHQQIW